MINSEIFFSIKDEVISVIEEALLQLFINYPENYVLFIASGEYNEFIAKNERVLASPYTISAHNLDSYYDYTREKFLCEFLNTHYRFTDEKELKDDEYRMSIEFLIYTHIWEAKVFLKRLYRLANLLTGKEYDWKFNNKKVKSKLINEDIVSPFKSANCLLGNIIENNYKTELRNAIAHSDYQIDIDYKKFDYASKTRDTVSFDEWSILFSYSVCLSYYFSTIFTGRRKRIIQDWGQNSFTIKMPFSDGTVRHARIHYVEDRDDFDFCR